MTNEPAGGGGSEQAAEPVNVSHRVELGTLDEILTHGYFGPIDDLDVEIWQEEA